jgi:SAM-dependent methyltransferase
VLDKSDKWDDRGMTLTDGYLLDNRQAGARERLDALAALFDPTTFRHFEAFGVGPGWRCWEVGASGASVVSWLAKRVGPTGKVVATNTDVSCITAPARPPVEVRIHDIAAHRPPGEGFDLVHARLSLTDVSDRARTLRTMTEALRPGGRLLVEDTDLGLQPLVCPDEHGPEQQMANRLRKGVGRLLASRGVDLTQGRRLPRLLRAAGLRRVEADVHFPLSAPACAALETATIRQVRGELVAEGFAAEADIDRHLANIASGTLDLAAVPVISAWGRKP